MLFYLLAGFLALVAIGGISAISSGSSDAGAVIIVIAAIVGAFLCVKRGRRGRKKKDTVKEPITAAAPQSAAAAQPEPQTVAQPEPQAAPDYSYIDFSVAGVTFDTNGVSRQEVLRKIKEYEAPFETAEDNITLKKSSFDGEPAIEVYANDFMIGHVPKRMINAVWPILDIPGAGVWTFQVVGGSGGRSYGGRVCVRYPSGSAKSK